MRFSPILTTGARTLVPTLVLFSLYLFVVGHDLPGGGFAGGLIGASALMLVFLAFGGLGLQRVLPADPEVLVGIGLALALVGGLIGWVFEGALLSYSTVSFSLPLVGNLKLTSSLVFDAGVYVLVLGLVATATLRLGGEIS